MTNELTLSKSEAEELAKDIKSFVLGKPDVVDDPNELSKLKMKLSAMLFFV